MNIIELPEHLLLDSSSPIQLYHYQINNSGERNKISLNKNAFSFLVEGNKELTTEKETTKIENDKFLMMKSGNCLMTETVSSTNKIYKSILLFFTDEVLLELLEKNKFTFPLSQSTHSFFVGQYDQYIRHFVQSLENISKLNKKLQKDLLKVKFEEIMIYLVQKEGIAFLNTLLDNQDDKMIRLINVVEHNKLNKLTLQELSFLCNRSLSTFKRDFKKHYHLTPIKWFQEKRLEHAAFLLSTQQKRPIELYDEAGYESLSNFVQAFKKQYGTTPKQFQLEKMNF